MSKLSVTLLTAMILVALQGSLLPVMADESAIDYREGRLWFDFQALPLIEALDRTATATGVDIRFPPVGLDGARVTLQVQGASLEDGLRQLLNGYNYMMVYERYSSGKQVAAVRIIDRVQAVPTAAVSTPTPPPLAKPLEVTLQRNDHGHYVMVGQINQQPAEFLVDTGATVVALSAELADSIGLAYGQSRQIETASGATTGFVTTLSRVDIGGLAMEQVDAIILPDMNIGGRVLLGMNFLRAFDLLQRNDVLTIRPRQAD